MAGLLAMPVNLAAEEQQFEFGRQPQGVHQIFVRALDDLSKDLRDVRSRDWSLLGSIMGSEGESLFGDYNSVLVGRLSQLFNQSFLDLDRLDRRLADARKACENELFDDAWQHRASVVLQVAEQINETESALNAFLARAKADWTKKTQTLKGRLATALGGNQEPPTLSDSTADYMTVADRVEYEFKKARYRALNKFGTDLNAVNVLLTLDQDNLSSFFRELRQALSTRVLPEVGYNAFECEKDPEEDYCPINYATKGQELVREAGERLGLDLSERPQYRDARSTTLAETDKGLIDTLERLSRYNAPEDGSVEKSREQYFAEKLLDESPKVQAMVLDYIREIETKTKYLRWRYHADERDFETERQMRDAMVRDMLNENADNDQYRYGALSWGNHLNKYVLNDDELFEGLSDRIQEMMDNARALQGNDVADDNLGDEADKASQIADKPQPVDRADSLDISSFSGNSEEALEELGLPGSTGKGGIELSGSKEKTAASNGDANASPEENQAAKSASDGLDIAGGSDLSGEKLWHQKTSEEKSREGGIDSGGETSKVHTEITIEDAEPATEEEYRNSVKKARSKAVKDILNEAPGGPLKTSQALRDFHNIQPIVEQADAQTKALYAGLSDSLDAGLSEGMDQLGDVAGLSSTALAEKLKGLAPAAVTASFDAGFGKCEEPEESGSKGLVTTDVSIEPDTGVQTEIVMPANTTSNPSATGEVEQPDGGTEEDLVLVRIPSVYRNEYYCNKPETGNKLVRCVDEIDTTQECWVPRAIAEKGIESCKEWLDQ